MAVTGVTWLHILPPLLGSASLLGTHYFKDDRVDLVTSPIVGWTVAGNTSMAWCKMECTSLLRRIWVPTTQAIDLMLFLIIGSIISQGQEIWSFASELISKEVASWIVAKGWDIAPYMFRLVGTRRHRRTCRRHGCGSLACRRRWRARMDGRHWRGTIHFHPTHSSLESGPPARPRCSLDLFRWNWLSGACQVHLNTGEANPLHQPEDSLIIIVFIPSFGDQEAIFTGMNWTKCFEFVLLVEWIQYIIQRRRRAFAYQEVNYW